MKKLFLLFLPFLGYSQNIYLEGYCYFHSLNDTLKECSQLTSQEIYTKDGSLLYEKIIPFGKTIHEEYKETKFGNPYNYKWYRKNDSTILTYYTDSINNKHFFIKNKRDSTIYQLFFDDKIIKKDSVVKGDFSVRVYRYNEKKLLDTLIYIDRLGNKLYNTYEYDIKGRNISTKMHTKQNRTDTSYAYVNTTFIDDENTEIRENGNVSWLEFKQTTITKFNDKNIPISKEFIYEEYGDVRRYKVIYKTVDGFTAP
jgi:hypothetical protein